MNGIIQRKEGNDTFAKPSLVLAIRTPSDNSYKPSVASSLRNAWSPSEESLSDNSPEEDIQERTYELKEKCSRLPVNMGEVNQDGEIERLDQNLSFIGRKCSRDQDLIDWESALHNAIKFGEVDCRHADSPTTQWTKDSQESTSEFGDL